MTQGIHALPVSACVYQSESPLNPDTQGFFRGFMSSHDWLNHWPLVIKFNLYPLSMADVEGRWVAWESGC